MSTLILPDDEKQRCITKAKEMLEGYDGKGIDDWNAEMINDVDGYDINVYEEEGAPLSITVYEVKNLSVSDDYGVYQNITAEVLA